MTQRQELVLGILFVVIVASAIVGLAGINRNAAPENTDGVVVTQTIPEFTEEVKAQLAASKGFQALISYTSQGFQPSTLTIKEGETVRFTNNSSEDLWIAANGLSGAVYPGKSAEECGQSAFDSCRVVTSGGFWEFTFDSVGTWSYQNNRNTQMTAVIRVQ